MHAAPLDRYHLLQVPRTAFMLSFVVVMLIGLILAANYRDIAATRFVTLFPMIILTGMVERFWTKEAEDGPGRRSKYFSAPGERREHRFAVSFPPLVNHLVNYPETIGVVMAVPVAPGPLHGLPPFRTLPLPRLRQGAGSENDQGTIGDNKVPPLAKGGARGGR